jgi:hypothetical protein
MAKSSIAKSFAGLVHEIQVFIKQFSSIFTTTTSSLALGAWGAKDA